MDLCSIQDIRALLDRHGFRFSRSMGQNFLTADWVPRETAAACGADSGCGVLEIGPGIGCLTQQLCRRAARVVSVELDRALLPVLAETMAGTENFTLLPGDILKLDLSALTDQYFSGLRPLVCANLPYNITTPVLQALAEARRFQTLTVMVQREAALRLTAAPGRGEYCAFSVYMQYFYDLNILFEVPPSCFFPAPKVTSAVLHGQLRAAPPVSPACGEDFLFQTIRAAFSLRRKTLRNSLASVFGHRRDAIAGAIAESGLPPTVRGEELDLKALALLADRLYEAMGNPPK